MLNEQQKISRFQSHNRLFGASKGHIEVDTVVPKRVPRAHPAEPAGLGANLPLVPLLERGESAGSTGTEAPMTLYSYPLDNFALTDTDAVHEAPVGKQGPASGAGAGAGVGAGAALSPSGIGVV